jgi:hypothetical protein
MFTLVRSISVRQLVTEQLPSLGLSLGIAEVAYKFHSFILEMIAFLVTWYIVDGLRYWVVGMLHSKQNSQAEP